MLTVSSMRRIASTAAPSAFSFSPRPTQPDAASAAASVTRTSSRARLRSGAVLNAPQTLCRARLGRGGLGLQERRRIEQVALAGRQEDDLRRGLLEDLQRLELEVAVGQRARAEPLRLRLAARPLDLLLRLGLGLLDLLLRRERVLRRDLLAL